MFAFHCCTDHALAVKPFLDTTPRGVFATRAPECPDAIGLLIVRLIEVDKNILAIEDVDMPDGTPLLDSKPYVPAFDAYPEAAIGWHAAVAKNTESFRSDGRLRL